MEVSLGKLGHARRLIHNLFHSDAHLAWAVSSSPTPHRQVLEAHHFLLRLLELTCAGRTGKKARLLEQRGCTSACVCVCVRARVASQNRLAEFMSAEVAALSGCCGLVEQHAFKFRGLANLVELSQAIGSCRWTAACRRNLRGQTS